MPQNTDTHGPHRALPRVIYSFVHLQVVHCAAYNYSSCITYLPSVPKGSYKNPRIDRNAAKSQWPSEIKRAPHNTAPLAGRTGTTVGVIN